MTTTSKSWDEVTAAFREVEKHLRKRFAQVGRDATAERTHLEKSVRGVVTIVEQFFGAASKTVRDPALRKDVLQVAETMRAALLSTLERAGEDIPEKARRKLSAHPSKRHTAPAKSAGRPPVKRATRPASTRTAKRSAAVR